MSGKGKSTMFKLVLGLYAPNTGRVYLKTKNGDIACGENTRHLFAYVPQDYALFSGTIRENLLLVSESAEEERKAALSLAQADFVWELTAGEQTYVRENNTGLSKGQLQRLAIARAILMDRPILLLDECTSALDAVTEQRVLAGLHSLGKQAVLVTHRPEMVENMGNIAKINMEK
jgi:ATP-binding cassette subfamily B protein